MKRSVKRRTVIQYPKSLPKIENEENEENEMEIQKIIEDIEDLEFVIQNILEQYSYNKNIQQDFKIIEKQVSFMYDKYAKSIDNKIEE